MSITKMTKADRRRFGRMGGLAKARKMRGHTPSRNGSSVGPIKETTLEDLVLAIAAVEREKIRERVLKAIG